jgi:glycosyltransferase involved in cell wall biosynthesis
VANLTPKKDHAGLIEAFEQVRAQVDGATLVIVGTGPLEEELHGLARDRGLDGAVRFLGSRADVPELLPGESWDVIVAPKPDPLPTSVAGFCSMTSKWISVNVLMLDEERVVVEKSQPSMIKVLKDHGFKPIPCAFSAYMPFGGSFHCATLDVRRRGGLQSYFP